MQDFTQAPYSSDAQAQRLAVNRGMMKTYNWMAVGLAISALCAYIAISTNAAISMFFDFDASGVSLSYLWWGCIIAELVLVFVISSRIQKMQVGTSAALFIIYAALNGFTLSPLLMAYTSASVSKAFILAAATFLAASAYGSITKRDLTSMGSFLFMALIGLIIAMVVNWFLKSPMVDYVISCVGVLIFIGLTAFDSQKIRNMLGQAANDVTVSKMAIMGALTLYLDFINLFIMLLRIFGDRR